MKIRRSCSLVVFFFFIAFIVFLSVQTRGTEEYVIYVDDSGGFNYTSIQDAIDSASSGDTVFVLPGIYDENIVINKSISLFGEDKETTVINGSLVGNTIYITADGVTVEGFTIQYSGMSFPNAGINVSSHFNIITGNIIGNNFYGITLFRADNNRISDNAISTNDHCGIYMSGSSNNIINGNIIQFHQFNGIGMYDSADNNTITDNTLTNNDFCGVNIRISSHNTVTQNAISDNTIGIHVPQEQYQNYIVDNVLFNNGNDIEQESGLPLLEFIIVVIVLVCLTVFIVFWKEKSQKNIPSSAVTEHRLDAQGNPCPIPLIMTKKKMKTMKKGEILEVITADVVAKENIERFGKEKHELVRIDKQGQLFTIVIKKK